MRIYCQFEDLKTQIVEKKVANINVDEGQNSQDEQLQGWADSPGSEYPGNLGENEDQQTLQNLNVELTEPCWQAAHLEV